MLAERNLHFQAAVKAADVRVPDGAGLIWARWYLRSPAWSLVPSLLAFLWQRVERVTGVDAIMTLARLCQEYSLPLYLLGGTAGQREQTAALLKSRFAGLMVVIASSSDNVADIKKQAPAVLLAAYGAPKQALWIEHARDILPSVRIAIGVGGAFGMLGEDLPRAPRTLRRMNLEWLWRLYLEPARARRIWQATVKFPLMVRRQKREG